MERDDNDDNQTCVRWSKISKSRAWFLEKHGALWNSGDLCSQNSRFVAFAFIFTQRFKIPVTWTGAKLQSTLEMQIFHIFFESYD